MASRSGSPSEGEIIESDSEKATKSLPSANGMTVDRPSRKLPSVSKSPSPTPSRRRDYRSRSRSPYREYRGSKRSRDDDHYNNRHDHRDRRDHRSFRASYDDRRHDKKSNQSSYRDPDRLDSKYSSRHDDRGSGKSREKRLRTVSRSPPRFNNRKSDGTDRKRDRRDSHSRGYHDDESKSNGGRFSREQSVSERGSTPGAAASSKPEAELSKPQNKSVSFKFGNGSKSDKYVPPSPNRNAQSTKSTLCRRETQDGNSEAQAVQDPPLSEAELIEQRRKRREAIKAKHKNQETPLLVQVLDHNNAVTAVESQPDSPASTSHAIGMFHDLCHLAHTDRGPDSLNISPPSTPNEVSAPDSPANFQVLDDAELANSSAQANGDVADEPSAADYDPTSDMQEDKRREDSRQQKDEVSARAYDETQNNDQDVLIPADDTEPAPKKGNEFDMFADDDDDMFADAPGPKKASGNEATKAVPVPRAAIDMSMLDDWDDEEGYYKIIIGELLEGRYHVQLNLGKGMFSAVVRALDQTTNKLVAIKIIRSNETMRKAALKEIDILGTLKAADPEDKKHMVRLERSFEHKGHLCMVFENLSINLREVLKKFGRDVGINLRAVRAYAQQMFLGLSLLRKCNILHADLKPDNVLVNESRNFLKICDLGSASDASENEITPYLVSRFYRAPEVILGLPYDFAIDMWSIGCTLFELFTGKILFTGRNNNQMLRSIMECRGKFSHKVLRKAQFAPLHFDDLLNFRSLEKDKLTGKDVLRMLTFSKPIRDLRARVMGAGGGKGAGEAEARELNLFLELLDKCLALNPERRITPIEALKHPFILRQK